VEFRRLLWLSRLLLLSVLAGDIAERKLRRSRLSVDGFRLLLYSRERLLLTFGFQSLAIFWSQDVGTTQVILGVDVLGMLLLALFARAFPFRGFGNILSVAIRYAEESAGEKQYARHKETMTAQQIPWVCEARPHRLRMFEVRCCHGNQLR
jgi:hypothetical protein